MAKYVSCPQCGGEPKLVSFTWWGGVVGPRVLSHVRCSKCGATFNGKSGKSNTVGIIIYTIIALVIAFAVAIAIMTAMNS